MSNGFSSVPVCESGLDITQDAGQLIGTCAEQCHYDVSKCSVNEYQLRLGRQRQVCLIPLAEDKTPGEHVNCDIP